MDKTQDVRRLKSTRFSPPNKQITKLSGPDYKNCRREKVRRLSFVESLCSKTLDCEMGSVKSDGEDEFCPSTSKKFKLPKKFFNHCQEVDHATVPRKLRSAMRKRSRESDSPQFPEVKKLKAKETELVKGDGMKKSKLKQPEQLDSSPVLSSVVPISKDEEEVAETLYALAGMFSDSDKTEKTNATAPDVADSQTIFSPTALDTAADSANNFDAAHGTEVIQLVDQGTDPDLHRCKQFPSEFRSCIPESDCREVSIFSKSTPVSGSPSSNSAVPNHFELSRGPRLKKPMHNLNMANEKKKEIIIESVTTFRKQSELQLNIKENKNSGSALYPGLSSTRVHRGKMPGSPVKFSSTKLPAWLGISSSNARSCSSLNVGLAEKEPRSHGDEKKTWKKCSTHVYITHLINVLKDTKSKENSPPQPTQFTAHEGSKQGIVSQDNNLHVIENGVRGRISANGISCSGSQNTSSKITNAIFLHKRLLEDQQQASVDSGPYAKQKQSFSFLSLSAGSCEVEHESVTGGTGNGHQTEPSIQSHVSYLHPFSQSHKSIPISLSHNYHNSTSVDSAAAQKVQIQLPPYLGNSCTSQSSLTGFQKQQFQQQQWLWAAQLTAPYKPEDFAAATAAHLPYWQNGRQESPCIMQYAQPLHPASLDVLGPRYIPVSAQQQQQKRLISSKSLLPQRYNHHQFPTSHGGGIFRPDNGSSMQLLCNEYM